jgi:acetoin utilization deacetylase AcuC-like enzyme/GNAT superfamily N-acetyltransferase
MIRFRRLFELTSDVDLRRFAEASELFRAGFPFEAEAIDRIAHMLNNRQSIGFDPIFLLATDGRDRITGLAFVYYFPDLDYGYLQYIASDPRRPARGIGTALYEALRELLAARGARGMFLDVPPVEPDKVDDKSRLPANRKRMRFYARYDAHKVAGTLWDVEANPRNEGFLTTLLYDPLGRRPHLQRRDARRVVRRILVDQYGYEAHDPFVARIVRSFHDQPVKLEALTPQPERAAPTRAKYVLPIKMVVSERHTIHHLREKGYVERPVRVTAILKGLEGLPIERVPTRHFSEDHLTAVHTPALVSYLKAMHHRLDEKAIVYPEVFPIRRPDRIPRALEDRAGYFCADTFTPLTQNVFVAARDAANVALTGASLILNGERFVYALCRPPGHHAERRIYGGFCFFNNSAIAAHYLSRHGRVALLDIDYHHGNGAQDIFYARNDVLTVSIHGHPSHAYPNFSGYSDERGEGAGLGFNQNFPVDPPVDDERYLVLLERALGIVRNFKPRFFVLSVGFDIMRGDPTGSFSVTTQGMLRIGRRIGSFGLPTLIVQEGGYSLGNLRAGSQAFFRGIVEAWHERPQAPAVTNHRPRRSA